MNKSCNPVEEPHYLTPVPACIGTLLKINLVMILKKSSHLWYMMDVYVCLCRADNGAASISLTLDISTDSRTMRILVHKCPSFYFWKHRYPTITLKSLCKSTKIQDTILTQLRTRVEKIKMWEQHLEKHQLWMGEGDADNEQVTAVWLHQGVVKNEVHLCLLYNLAAYDDFKIHLTMYLI